MQTFDKLYAACSPQDTSQQLGALQDAETLPDLPRFQQHRTSFTWHTCGAMLAGWQPVKMQQPVCKMPWVTENCQILVCLKPETHVIKGPDRSCAALLCCTPHPLPDKTAGNTSLTMIRHSWCCCLLRHN